MKLGLVQMSCDADPGENLYKGLEGIAEAAALGASIACLPELFRTQYFCQEQNVEAFDLAEPVPGPTTEALAAAAEAHDVAVVGSVFERRAAGIYHNTAVVLDAGGRLAGVYRKMHIPDDPLYCEKFYFTPGDLGFGAVETRFGRVGALVCWDQWFPEAARLAALAGAQILVYPTAIGWHPHEKRDCGERQAEAWQVSQRAHAISNGVFVAAVNRTGVERTLERSPSRPADYRGLEFWGRSFVADPLGGVVAEAGPGEEVLVAECDLSEIEQTRRDWPFLRDRRIDAYEGLTRRSLG
ncbi:MAG: carbon-nitrogen hydrolase [Bryobacterales bacterium]|nr:carbon-nitrogen hydrolase [Bryobacterales bacterium]